MVWRHPKYYEELKRIRKQFEKEQADKRASEQARRAGGPASRGASKQALKRRKRIQAASAECVPNHSLRGKVFRGGLRADRGPRCF